MDGWKEWVIKYRKQGIAGIITLVILPFFVNTITSTKQWQQVTAWVDEQFITPRIVSWPNLALLFLLCMVVLFIVWQRTWQRLIVKSRVVEVNKDLLLRLPTVEGPDQPSSLVQEPMSWLRDQVECVFPSIRKVSLYLRDPNSKEQIIHWNNYPYRVKGDSICISPSKRFFVGEYQDTRDQKNGLAGTVFLRGTSQIAHFRRDKKDTGWATDNNRYILFPEQKSMTAKACICVPILKMEGDKEVLGVLCCYSDKETFFDPPWIFTFRLECAFLRQRDHNRTSCVIL
jgi:hypothetical protein